MHDDQEAAIDTVPEVELGLVGTPTYAITFTVTRTPQR